MATAAAVRSSTLDWTLLRLPLLNSKPPTGRVRAGYLGRGEVGTSLTRADLATFLLAQLADPTYLRRAPAISNERPRALSGPPGERLPVCFF